MTLALVAMRIAATLEDTDLVYLADDEQQAAALAAAVRALCPDRPVFHIPSSDALPGDAAPASPANAGRRVAALHGLRRAHNRKKRSHLACILSGEAAARRYAAPETFDDAPPTLTIGDDVDTASFADTLTGIGYVADDRVDEPGEMAVRGDVVDIFPADAERPVRIDLVDGRITAIRCYDPASQRTESDLEAIEIGRAAEPPIADAVVILDHLADAALGMSDKAEERRQRFVRLATDVAARRDGAIDAIDDERWSLARDARRTIAFDEQVQAVPRFAQKRQVLAAFARFVKPLLDERTLVIAGRSRDIRFLRPRIAKRLRVAIPDAADWQAIVAAKPGTALCTAMPIETGFVDDRLIVVAAADLLGSRAAGDDASPATDTPFAQGAAIRIGDVIVHEDHGVGRIVDLEPAPAAQGDAGEMIVLEYAHEARRLVAIDDADRIWRYGADADAVTLDGLDGASWHKRRGAIDAAIAESAKGLAALAEARATLEAPVMTPDTAAYERFASGFAFHETADQARAIAAVRDDLASGTPMDRLVVGDVGYGKTEVALRAAALVALAGHQVVVAAPTTVLVRQHIDSFTQRFEGTGITVAGLSRLSSAAEKKAVKAGLADGSIGIVVGTGAVMAKGVRYARLGLVIVDEEQRFGAADKTRLRGTGDVHLLTLTATPIPRTLQMALIGLQQISIIATPPARRQPIRTSIDRYDDTLIRTALLREKSRGGQSFVVVPRIEDMATVAETLRRIVPELGLVEAHGKMPAADTDAAMVGFARGDGDILLATNIIEAGLDVPRANTMIVWRADRFGLAQLHQLRGRVGRGNRRGQVILLTQGDGAIAERTLKRLRTLATFDRLGAGFDISAQDLDMRGAGDLLGENQAGHIRLIGIDLYQFLLSAALRRARGEDVERWTPELHVGSGGRFPDDWIPEPDVRLSLYVRLSRIEDDTALDAFEDELVDRFGPLPDRAASLIARTRIRLGACAARIQRIDAGPAAIALTPRHGLAMPDAATGLVEKDGRWLLSEKTEDAERIDRVRALLEAVAV